MAQRAEDVLVTLLNIDAEIRTCIDYLAKMERSPDDGVTPWDHEVRTALRTEIEVLRARREERFRTMNAIFRIAQNTATSSAQ